jgi:hypothetical protein
MKFHFIVSYSAEPDVPNLNAAFVSLFTIMLYRTEQNRTFISDLYKVHHHIHYNIQVTCTLQCNQYKEINTINNIKKLIIVMKLKLFVFKPQLSED